MEMLTGGQTNTWNNTKSPETKMLTDRQTDVGHINLIGRLLACNPRKNAEKSPLGEVGLGFEYTTVA